MSDPDIDRNKFLDKHNILKYCIFNSTLGNNRFWCHDSTNVTKLKILLNLCFERMQPDGQIKFKLSALGTFVPALSSSITKYANWLLGAQRRLRYAQ